MRTYHHYFYEVKANVEGEYFSLDELLNKQEIKDTNADIIGYIKEYYKD